LAVTDGIGRQLHISSKWASRAGFLVLWGIGMTFIQVDEYFLALLSWVLSAVVLFSKAVHWGGIDGRPQVTSALRILLIVAAASFIPISVLWTQAKRGSKPWTNFAVRTLKSTEAQLKPAKATSPSSTSEGQHQTAAFQTPSSSSALLPLSVSPTKLIFEDQQLGTTSEPQTVTVVNRGSAPRFMSPLKMAGDFSQTNDCGPELMVGDSCNIAVSFAPTKLGLTYSSLEIPSSDPLQPTIYINPAAVTFSGTGKATPAIPPPPPKLAVLPLKNCQPRGTWDSWAVGVAQKQGATMTSFVTDGKDNHRAPFPRHPKRVYIEPPGLAVEVTDLPKEVVLGKCGDRVCKLTITGFADDGVTLDTRMASVFTEKQEICGVEVKITVLEAQ